MRVVRVYHSGRDPAHRERDLALVAAGADLVLVVPRAWPEPGAEAGPVTDGFPVVALPVRRVGDVNRHRYASTDLAPLLRRLRPDVLDVHEEPFSVAAHQWLTAAPPDLPAVAYTAQNLDKRLPPPFVQYERSAYHRLAGLYPCSRQAASVAWGKGFRGAVEVLPLGVSAEVHRPGTQDVDEREALLVLAGRMVHEKGVEHAVFALSEVARRRPARLILAGDGPALPAATLRANRLGIPHLVDHRPWLSTGELAALLRRAHVALVPSMATSTWVEQFGRGVVEAQACGAVVVAYASGALPEVVGDAGLLVAEGDVRGLGRAVSRLLDDPARWRSLRERGLALARSRRWEVVAAAQLDLYQRVLERPHPLPLAPSGRHSRAEAVSRFGPPARPRSGVARPFADPILRRVGAAQVPLGTALDVVTRSRWR